MTDSGVPSPTTWQRSLKLWGIGHGVIVLGLVALLAGFGPRHIGSDNGALALTGFGGYLLLSMAYSVALTLVYLIQRHWMAAGVVLMAMGASVTLGFGLCCVVLSVH